MRLPCLEDTLKISHPFIHFYYTMASVADHTPPSTYNSGPEYCQWTCCPSWGLLLLQKGLLTAPVKNNQSVLERIMAVPYTSH